MKSYIEIIKIINARGWSAYRLAQMTGVSEADINRAIRNADEIEMRRRIAGTVGMTYDELFGESK